MAKVGYYRYRVNDLAPRKEPYEFKWIVNDEVKCISKVYVLPKCEDSIYIKYMDRNGMYRFIIFNQYWKRTQQVKSLGTVDVIADYNSESSIGYDRSEVYTLTASNVNAEMLAVYGDVFFSPNVYMRLPNSEEWISVTVAGDGIDRTNKLTPKTFTLTVTNSNVRTITK